MRTFIATLAAAMVEASAHGEMAEIHRPIEMWIDGVLTTKYIASDICRGSGYNLICPENGRAYIVNKPTFDIKEPDFFAPNLLNSSIEWDVDLKDHDCGCMNAFFTVSMPGRKETGDLDLQDGYFYCDANVGKLGGEFCPELDLMKANKHGWETAVHTCDEPDENGHYDDCDGDDDMYLRMNSKTWLKGKLGPDSETIDTNKPFHIRIDLEEKDGQLSGIKTIFSQEGRFATMHDLNADYLNNMSAALKNGQVFVLSNWSGDGKEELDEDQCSGKQTCSAYQTMISNIRVTRPVIPPFNPDDYEWGGGHCAHKTDDLCGRMNCPSAEHCKWSWIKGGDWNDPTAQCRCNVVVGPAKFIQ